MFVSRRRRRRRSRPPECFPDSPFCALVANQQQLLEKKSCSKACQYSVGKISSRLTTQSPLLGACFWRRKSACTPRCTETVVETPTQKALYTKSESAKP
jgi:hypothetical protein